jgi:hypothetical protein
MRLHEISYNETAYLHHETNPVQTSPNSDVLPLTIFVFLHF